MGGVTRSIAKNILVVFKQVFPIVVGVMTYLHTSGFNKPVKAFRFNTQYKTCVRFTPFLSLPWKQAQTCYKMVIK